MLDDSQPTDDIALIVIRDMLKVTYVHTHIVYLKCSHIGCNNLRF